MAKSQAQQILTQIETKKDPAMIETQVIRLPRMPGEELQEVTVGINGIIFKIQRGKEVSVPRAVAEVLRNSEEMEAVSQEYLEKLQEKRI